MATHPLLKNDNPYLRKTEWTQRPARNDPKWRYVGEGELVRNQDLWDQAEQHRRQVDTNVAALAADGKRRSDEAEKARQEREDAILDDELKRRYLSGGGTESGFIVNRSRIRAEFATAVAIGQAEPLTPTIDQIKAELRQLRGHRLAAPDPRP